MTAEPPRLGAATSGLVKRTLTSVAAVLAHVPEIAAYGLVALGPLGARFGPQAMALALLSAVAASAVASLMGAGRVAAGPRSAQALLTAALVASLAAQPWASTDAGLLQLLVCVVLAMVGAGLLQCLFGWVGLGNLIKYVPHPVRLGLTTAVGLLLLSIAVPLMMGQPFGTALWPGTWPAQAGPAAAIGLSALATCWLAARWLAPVPPLLAGLCVATVLHLALQAWTGGPDWGATMAVPRLPAVDLPALGQAAQALLHTLDLRTATLLAGYALSLALLSSLDTLLAASYIDARLRRRRPGDRELVAQGLASIAGALIGANATAASITRSLALAPPLPQARHIMLDYAVLMLAFLLLTPTLLGLVPTSALGGILVAQGVTLAGPVFWRATRGLRSLWRTPDPAAAGEVRVLAGHWTVTLAVLAAAVVWGLGPGVLIGAGFAILLFVRANVRDVVRFATSGQARRSLKVRTPEVRAALQDQGHRTVLLELEGPLFFGTADALDAQLSDLPASVHTAVLDLCQVPDIDVTAARILVDAAQNWHQAGRQLVLAEWPPGDKRRQLLEVTAGPQAQASLVFADDADRGLELAEQRLIDQLALPGHGGSALALHETVLARGLPAEACARLLHSMDTLHFAQGTVLFRQGDAGTGLYVLVRGEVGLRLPGSARRLASFAPGAMLGEMAVLSQAPRSAEAVAESDVTALFLSQASFDRLLHEEPALAAQLLKTMAQHLADRVRGLTGDLAHWVSRAAVKQPAMQPSVQPPGPGTTATATATAAAAAGQTHRP